MAVELAERPVREVTRLLQTYLGTQLTAIELDRGDGITLTIPTVYHNRSVAGSIQGDAAQIEVFDGAVDFAQPYSVDVERGVYTIPVTARVTVFNRDGATAEEMETRRRRYQAAMVNVFLVNHADLNSDPTDAALHLAEPLSIPDPVTEIGTDGNVLKFQASVVISLRCEEVQ